MARLHLLCPVCGRRFRSDRSGGWFCGAGHEAPPAYYALRPTAVAPADRDAVTLPRPGRDTDPRTPEEPSP